MVQSVPTERHEEMRRRCEARFPYFKNIKAQCFNWPDGEPTILFVRAEGGECSARVQNVELRVSSLRYEITTWTEEIIEDPCDDNQQRCADGKDMRACDCPHTVRACVETGSETASHYSAPWPTWDEQCTSIRNRLRKYYKRYNPAALVFADATWDFRK